MTKYLVLFMLAMSFGLKAQDLTKVRFFINGGSSVFIKLDGEILPVSNVQSIAPGEHKIEVWSPTYTLYKSKITIPEKDSVGHYIELKPDKAYIEHQFAMDDYKQKVFMRKTAPLMLAGAGVLAFPFLHISRKNMHEELIKENFKSQYFRVSAESAESRYNTMNALYFGSIGAAVLGTGLYFALRNNVKSLKKPVYIQQNPFTLEDFRLSLNEINHAPEIGLQLSF
jgi:hypothetical protein